jgi:glycosyltransferase involved in cell wall biosynthesis
VKIFYQYAKAKTLTPDRGDFINEINIIKALKRFSTVIYANRSVKCDVHYVRANPTLFKKLPNPKVYFASPYNKIAFRQADAIATFSQAWTDRLRAGKYTAGCEEKITKPIITLHQVIDTDFFKPYNKSNLKVKKIRRHLGGGFIIGQFGKMRNTNFPHTFLKILPKLKKEYPDINVVFSDKTGITSNLIKECHFPYDQMPYVLSACDLLLFPYWASAGHFSGALRTKEAMACGVPITSPRFDARVEEFGEDYPFFYPAGIKEHYRSDVMKGMYDVISLAIEDEKLRKDVGKTIRSRSEFYSIEQASKRIQQDFNKVVNG